MTTESLAKQIDAECPYRNGNTIECGNWPSCLWKFHHISAQVAAIEEVLREAPIPAPWSAVFEGTESSTSEERATFNRAVKKWLAKRAAALKGGE